MQYNEKKDELIDEAILHGREEGVEIDGLELLAGLIGLRIC